jgi:hypothetical protein
MNPASLVSSPGNVQTMHVLCSGEIVDSLEAFQKVEERFGWVNRRDIVTRILQLRTMTDERKRSVIVLYEDGRRIREFINVDGSFRPLIFY